MRLPLAASFRALIRPATAFALPPPALGGALRDMALIWMPLALLNASWTLWRVIRTYEDLRSGTGLPRALVRLGVHPGDYRDLISMLPAPPEFSRVWPWLLLAVPLGVLGNWLHHAVWDHMSLWLLGGLKERRGFRTSLLAEAQALRVTAVGILPGFLGYLPVLGVLLLVPLGLLEAYLWGFRGFALAARHGCEPWRGVAATVLHALLLCVLALALVALLLLLAWTAT